MAPRYGGGRHTVQRIHPTSGATLPVSGTARPCLAPLPGRRSPVTSSRQSRRVPHKGLPQPRHPTLAVWAGPSQFPALAARKTPAFGGGHPEGENPPRPPTHTDGPPNPPLPGHFTPP